MKLVSAVPSSLGEYLNRRAKLWSLVQGYDPRPGIDLDQFLEEVKTEKEALESFAEKHQREIFFGAD